jgi:hypothetical protein
MKSVYVLTTLSVMVSCFLFSQDTWAQDPISQQCIECHQQGTPGIVQLWRDSRHSTEGTACIDCHKRREGDPSVRWHFGTDITPIPSPLACAECHPEEVEQNARSKHAWTAFMGPRPR